MQHYFQVYIFIPQTLNILSVCRRHTRNAPAVGYCMWTYWLQGRLSRPVLTDIILVDSAVPGTGSRPTVSTRCKGVRFVMHGVLVGWLASLWVTTWREFKSKTNRWMCLIEAKPSWDEPRAACIGNKNITRHAADWLIDTGRLLATPLAGDRHAHEPITAARTCRVGVAADHRRVYAGISARI